MFAIEKSIKSLSFRKIGFTLAEVLITLTIIGVVASLTIPVLTRNIQNTQNKVAWKKAFSEFSQAAMMLANDNDGSLAGLSSSQNSFMNNFLPYLKYVKLCYAGVPAGTDGCWHAADKFYELDGDIYNSDWSPKARLILSNGILVTFSYHGSTCTYAEVPNDDGCGNIAVDVNGYKSPNTVGIDIYRAYVLRDGTVIPYGTQGDDFYNDPAGQNCDLKTSPDSTGWNCSADYLYK